MKAEIPKNFGRADGKLKVKGEAKYTAEIPLPEIVHAAIVGSTIANGLLTSIETGAAEKAEGVIAVLTSKNAPKLKPTNFFNPGGKIVPLPAAASTVLPLQENKISYRGQAVACVVAKTLEQARFAASLIKAKYQEQNPLLNFDKEFTRAETPETVWGSEPLQTDGNPDRALIEAEVKIDETYTTPFEHHSAMELHAATAVWANGELIVYDSSRYIQGERRMLAEIFGIPLEKVRVIAKFIGGAFGEKGAVRQHVPLAAMCAITVKRPVKLELTRRQTTETTGHRPFTSQRIALGADKNGKLSAIIHEGSSTCAAVNFYVEPFTLQTFHLYAAANRRINQKIVRLNAAQPTTMRAPGEVPGMFALESAMDELADKLKIDPIELRRLNEPELEPVSGKQFSNRRLISCLERGAQAFGWERRKQTPRSNREGRLLIGYGVAAAVYPLKGNPTSARCRIFPDGNVVIQSSTHDFGNGVATVMRQIASDALGIPYQRIVFEYGDTALPPAPIGGGSTITMWVGMAVKTACEQAKAQIVELARQSQSSPLYKVDGNQIGFLNARLFLKDNREKGETYQAILSRSNNAVIETLAEAKPDEEKKKRFAMDSFGAHFCEVAVDEDLGEVRVRRHLGVFNCGKIINPQLAHSQFIGAIVMGHGMALTEFNALDERTGAWIYPDLADYHVPVAADSPKIDVMWLNEPDEQVNALGAKGVGEIGIVGVPAAIANAVFNATGKRVRTLPITTDKLL